jgi:hypothetical protein
VRNPKKLIIFPAVEIGDDYYVRVQAEQFHAGDPGIVPSP